MTETLLKGLILLHHGGWVMVPMMILSVTSMTVVIERILTIREAAFNNGPLLDKLRPLVQERKFEEAAALCAQSPGPAARILGCSLKEHASSLEEIERTMEEAALREIPALQHNLGILDTIITMAPLLGLLGTITGMIQAFNVVSTVGSGAPTAITGGVAEALIATASGLTVAISTLPFYNYLSERVKELVADIEFRSTQMLNLYAALKYEDRANQEPDPVRAMLWREQAILQTIHGERP